jgi:hypothetical protein
MTKAKTTDMYDGPVCYQDGWHWSIKEADDGGHEPDAKLFLDDDGSYRIAAETDESWHDRKHERLATIDMEDGAPGLRVTADEFDAVKEFLNDRREEAD